MIDLKKKLYIKLGHEYTLHKSDGNGGYIGTIENGREIFYHRASGNIYAKSSPTKNKHPFEDSDFDLTNDSLGIINEVEKEVPKAPYLEEIIENLKYKDQYQWGKTSWVGESSVLSNFNNINDDDF